MPIYEYACSNCHKTSDVLQKISDPPPEKCPACGAAGTLSRVVSRTSFVLKGGGWYADLYGSKKPAEAATPPAGEAAKSDGTAAPATPPAAAATPTAAPASGESSSTSAPASTPSTAASKSDKGAGGS
jgi:putative FmdB family regulatory protein